MFGPVSGEEMRAAQLITGSAMALWLAIGYLPALRPHATRLRGGLLVVYLLAAAAVFAHMALR
jgi:hypothetical protein